jgi:hypothetical protein
MTLSAAGGMHGAGDPTGYTGGGKFFPEILPNLDNQRKWIGKRYRLESFETVAAL